MSISTAFLYLSFASFFLSTSLLPILLYFLHVLVSSRSALSIHLAHPSYLISLTLLLELRPLRPLRRVLSLFIPSLLVWRLPLLVLFAYAVSSRDDSKMFIRARIIGSRCSSRELVSRGLARHLKDLLLWSSAVVCFVSTHTRFVDSFDLYSLSGLWYTTC